MMHSLLTIRETVKSVYPQINDATIHSWMVKGVFRPCIYEAPPTGPGRGCKLDIADLVTIGVLHSLLRFGLKFKEINLDDPRSTEPLMFDDSSLEDPSSLKKFEMKEVPIHLSGRRIQTYLEKHEFKVWVAWAPNIISNKRPRYTFINFYPHKNDKWHRSWVESMEHSPFETLGYIFINCETWLKYVQDKLVTA
jgi:hypothetical protein